MKGDTIEIQIVACFALSGLVRHGAPPTHAAGLGFVIAPLWVLMADQDATPSRSEASPDDRVTVIYCPDDKEQT